MESFRIVEITDANTICVFPKWFGQSENGEQMEGDLVKIRGLNVEKDNVAVKNRLEVFIDKQIELKNAALASPNLPTEAQIECDVILQNSNITYYFPEYADKVFA